MMPAVRDAGAAPVFPQPAMPLPPAVGGVLTAGPGSKTAAGGGSAVCSVQNPVTFSANQVRGSWITRLWGGACACTRVMLCCCVLAR